MSTFPYGPRVAWLADVKDVRLQFVRVVTDKQQTRHDRDLVGVSSKDFKKKFISCQLCYVLSLEHKVYSGAFPVPFFLG